MTSLAGAAELADDEELPLEPHPAAAPASTTAAPIMAADLVNFTALSFPALFHGGVARWRLPRGLRDSWRTGASGRLGGRPGL
jgi:hypothetical protein